MKPGKFIVIFQPLAEVHLKKDVGGVAVALSKYWGIDHHFIGGKLTPKGAEFSSATLCHVSSKIIQKLGFLYTAARIVQAGDIVNIYHLSPLSSMTIMTLRLVYGDRIKIYLKLDMNTQEQSLRIARIIAGTAFANTTREILSRIVGRWICSHVDFMSAESSTVFFITSRWPSKNIFKIPNGIFEEEYPPPSQLINARRDNRFVSVARHGSAPKRSELLLDAFSIAKLPNNWTLSLVGDYTREFKELVDETIMRMPHLKDKIVLHGPINDRDKLLAILSCSRVFTAVSAYEGFSLALLEAAACGCYCVSTNTGGASDVIGENGILLDQDADPAAIALALEMAVSESIHFNHVQFAMQTANQFSWKTVLKPLADALLFQASDCDQTDELGV